jgi:hypothetical protein
MSRIFASMEDRKKEPRIKQVRRQKTAVDRGVDTKKFCGVLKLKEDPLVIQKRLRDEWA